MKKKESKPAASAASLLLGDLKDNPKNPRLPFSEEQAKAFAAAYAKFGDLGVIVANRRFDYRLVGGHKRKGALTDAYPGANVVLETRLAAPDAQGTVAWGWINTKDGRYALRVVDWDDSTELAANLAANQFGAEFDWDAVNGLLKQIDGSVDIALTGFTKAEMEAILNVSKSGIFARPDIVTEETSECKKDGFWFYVEFYGQPKEYKAAQAALEKLGLIESSRSEHNIDAGKFLALLKRNAT